MSEPFDEGFITRYLLGDLPEQEQIEIEDRAFTDARVMQDVLAVEADLIDEYVQGRLKDRERRQFETRFLASAERRQKVEFARALAQVARESVLTETIRRPSAAIAPATLWTALLATFRSTGPAFRLSLAAASLVLVVGLTWLTVHTLRVRSELAQAQSEQQDLEQRLADERARSQKLADQLQGEQQQRERDQELIRELERPREEPANDGSQSAILWFALLPGVSRSGGSATTLTIPQSTRLVRFQIGIQPGDDYKSFRVNVLSSAGRQIWAQDNLSARSGRGGPLVLLSVPARLLSAAEYELALKGVTDDGRTEDVGYYYFKVRKN